MLAKELKRRLRRAAVAVVAAAVLAGAALPARAQRYDGFNVVAVPSHPFGSAAARESLGAAQRAGASAVAVVPFLWQRDPQHAEIVRGADLPDQQLRAAIRDARAAGLKVLVKPQVWVEGHWAGSVEPASPESWRVWFDHYRTALLSIAQLATQESADGLVIGTELERTTQRAEWHDLIAATRKTFPGLLTYAAHNLEEAEAVPFWGELDAIGITLYPALGADDDREGRRAIMHAVAERLDALAQRHGRPVLVAEIGIRSAVGAAAKPWESAEERTARPDPDLQAQVLADWLAALRRPAVLGVLVWRWFTDPTAGGRPDTDFTVQGKPAERMFACEPAKDCPD